MLRWIPVLVAGVFALSGAPALALTAKDKMATCRFGADDQKLQGKAKTAFLPKCMAGDAKPKAKQKPAG